jgi:hypothetical protein
VGAARDTQLDLAPGVGATVRVRRLSPAVFTARAEARVAGGEAIRPLARRATLLVAVLAPARLTLRAALTTGDTLDGDAGAVIDGRDTLPVGWACDPADSASVAAVAMPPGVPPPVATLAGIMPPVLTDSDATSAARYRLAPPPGTAPGQRVLELPALVRPDVRPRLAPDGACDVARDDVWGDPVRPSPCGGHLPVVHVSGDLVEPRGVGQGVLVVDGDLLLDDGLEFWGVVIVGGRVVARGGRIVGALLVHGRPGSPGDVSGLRLRWSSCVAMEALRAAGGVRPAAERGWQSGG